MQVAYTVQRVMHARQLFRENYAGALRYTAITSLLARTRARVSERAGARVTVLVRVLALVAILREKKFDRARERTRVKLTLCRRGIIAQSAR